MLQTLPPRYRGNILSCQDEILLLVLFDIHGDAG